MKTTIKLPETLLSTSISTTEVATLSIIALVGILLGVATKLLPIEGDSTISLTLSLMAVICLVIAAAKLLSVKQVVLAKGGSPLIEKTIDFPESARPLINTLIANNKWDEIAKTTQGGSGTIMKLELVYSKDRSFAAYQFFHYVPHLYEPCSDIHYIEPADAARINLS